MENLQLQKCHMTAQSEKLQYICQELLRASSGSECTRKPDTTYLDVVYDVTGKPIEPDSTMDLLKQQTVTMEAPKINEEHLGPKPDESQGSKTPCFQQSGRIH